MNSTKRNHRLVCAAAMCAVTVLGLNSSAFAADTFHVDDDAGLDSNTGLSWAQAYKTLYKALSVADGASGDQIWVAKGTYYPDDGTGDDDNRSLSFDMIEDVPVYGGFLNGDVFGQRDPIANETILSGDIDQDGEPDENSEQVVVFYNLTGDPALLDGFTVQEGNADGAESVGGGVYIFLTDEAKIQNCTIKDNLASIGGGLGTEVNSATSLVSVRNCRFENNAAGLGGGIGHRSSTGEIRILNTTFSANDAPGQSDGGAVYSNAGTVTIVNATFTENTTGDNGAGAYFIGTVDALLINCLFLYNTAADLGGAIYVAGSATAVLENCTLSKNHSDDRGGGIVGNTSIAITVTNSVLWGNTDVSGTTNVEQAQIYRLSGPTPIVTYTCIQDDDPDDGDIPYGGAPNNNIDDDPIFVDEDGSNSSAFDSEDNFRLHNMSPCIEKGDNDAVDCDLYDVDEDGDDCATPQFTPDLDFGDRIVDVDVDMGAYEFAPCPWDLDDDCSVGASDLLALLAAWGSDPGGPPDFDGDENVGASDLLALLANWGACQCDPTAVPGSLEDEMDAHCLTMTHWDDFEDVMTNPQSSQAEKDNYLCWMLHYLEDCSRCFCIGESGCPDDDPFNG